MAYASMSNTRTLVRSEDSGCVKFAHAWVKIKMEGLVLRLDLGNMPFACGFG